MGALIAAIATWNNILPGLVAAGQNGLAAYEQIKAVLAAHGIQADTDALDKVIIDAGKRKAHEDDILNG
jgi:hypothetical protein